jgi:hypothetical protein
VNEAYQGNLLACYFGHTWHRLVQPCYRASNDRIHNEKLIGKYMEGSGRV